MNKLKLGLLAVVLFASTVYGNLIPRSGVDDQISYQISGLGTSEYTIQLITQENLSQVVQDFLWSDQNRPVQWSLAQNAVYDISDGGDHTQIQQAADVWGNISDCDFSFQETAFDGTWQGGDGDNDVGWIYDATTWNNIVGSSSAIGATLSRYSGNNYLEFDLLLNGAYFYWYADSNDQFYSQSDAMHVGNIALHELGHGAGLKDLYNSGNQGYQPWMGTNNSEATMYGYSSGHDEDMTLSWIDEGAMKLAYVPEPTTMGLLLLGGLALLRRRK
ncbi:MAG: PEP-CTERM sorting domain-containing protein [Phycisphaerae bacterium]